MTHTKPISFQEFDALYQPVVDATFKFWTPEMQAEIARHCSGWAPGAYDFEVYLRCSSIRFYTAYKALLSHGAKTVCDIGGFGGVFPIVMKKLGFDMVMTEALKYYSAAFTPLFDAVRNAGVTIIDYDPFEDRPGFPDRFDAVTCMAVLEHYPHSPHFFMSNLESLVKPSGAIYLEVPNIAYWPKRAVMLLGKSPLPDISEIYSSAVPFIGHHHEYTMVELKKLASLSALEVKAEYAFNYSKPFPRTPANHVKLWLTEPIRTVGCYVLPNAMEIISVLCTPKGTAA